MTMYMYMIVHTSVVDSPSHLPTVGLLPCRSDINRLCEEFLDKSAEEALESDIPLLFITFPSTKDPTFNQPDRFPGQ